MKIDVPVQIEILLDNPSYTPAKASTWGSPPEPAESHPGDISVRIGDREIPLPPEIQDVIFDAFEDEIEEAIADEFWELENAAWEIRHYG